MNSHGPLFSPFYVDITELSTLERQWIYLAQDFGDWKVQTTWPRCLVRVLWLQHSMMEKWKGNHSGAEGHVHRQRNKRSKRARLALCKNTIL